MIFRGQGQKRYIYRCTQCRQWVGYGDRYCKQCGHPFSTEDVEQMKAAAGVLQTWRSPNYSRFDEVYRCPDCTGFVAIDHRYCKQCGHEFSEGERIVMSGDHDAGRIPAAYVAIPFILIMLALFTWAISGFPLS